MSANNSKFYIDGAWVDPIGGGKPFEVVNPATEEVAGTISLGSAADVDRAVAAAKAAFPSYSATSVEERIKLLRRIKEVYNSRYDEVANAITTEMGAPKGFARDVQTKTAVDHFDETIDILGRYRFEYIDGSTLISKEAIGVCGFITPWNWPINQVVAKLAPALATGCTSVLKPSEIAPLSAILLAEILHEAGVPKGVFNLVNGDGPTVGAAISSHPDIDMVSFTGSTRAGILIAKAAAETVKRVTQELGGKSANIILPDADLKAVIAAGTMRCFYNTGQSCQAPTRMFVQAKQYDEAVAIAAETARNVKVGDPKADGTILGPLVSKMQFEKVQHLIEVGIKEGATLAAGGTGRPEGVNRGYFVRPTVFANVTPDMTIAREEIFGPVLSMLSYDTEEQAIAMANATSYGLAGYVQSGSVANARRVASKLRAGRIYMNGAPSDTKAPFGGYKQSGNGREHGEFGFDSFLEVKAVLGYGAA